MNWNVLLNETNDIDKYIIKLESNGLKFSSTIKTQDIENFIKRKQLLIKNKRHNMYLHIAISNNIDGIQYVDSDNENDNNDFKLRFDGINGSQILEKVKIFWEEIQKNQNIQKKKGNNKLIEEGLENILIKWCNENLTNERAWGSKEEIKFDREINEKLLYRDGTSCSASSALNAIFRKIDGTYVIGTEIGIPEYYSGKTNYKYEYSEHKNIMEVIDYLIQYSFHDNNSVTELLFTLTKKYEIKLNEGCYRDFKGQKIPILSKCEQNNISLINAINNEMYCWKNYHWNR